MIGLKSRTVGNPSTPDEVLDFTRTIRIEPDRAHLARLLCISLFGVLFVLVVAGWHIAHPDGKLPWAAKLHASVDSSQKAMPADLRELSKLQSVQRYWSPSLPVLSMEIGLAALLATLGVLRIVYRLQDNDPVLTISPQGISLKPGVFGELVHVPWIAIRAIKMRKIKQQRRIAFQIENADRYAPHIGISLRWLRSIDPTTGTRTSTLSVTVPPRTAANIEATLAQYLAHFRAPSTPPERTASRYDASRKWIAIQPIRDVGDQRTSHAD